METELLQRVGPLLALHEPRRGPFGSTFECEDAVFEDGELRVECVEVRLLCEWKPRHSVQTVFVYGLEDGVVTYNYDCGGDERLTATVEKLAEELADCDS